MEIATEKAATLIEALSYIQRFRDKTVVVKVGGSFVEDDAARRSVLTDIVFMRTVGIHPILVHGGGPAISKAMKEARIEPRWVQGLRYTDADTLSIVQDVLISTINKGLVDEIRQLGGQAEPIHPRSRPVLKARREWGKGDKGEKVDLGFVGDVTEVDTWILSRLTHEDVIPVIAPLGLGEDGQVYNVNADTAAARVAVAAKAEKLVNMSDTHGIRTEPDDPASLASSLHAAEIQKLIDAGKITGGMIPKVGCCLTAVRGGVRKSHIIDGRIKHSLLLEIYTDQGVGTEIVE
jgi:acetylglutamate kinase